MAAPALGVPIQDGKPIIFAEAAGEMMQTSTRLQRSPLLNRWPRDYTGFRLDGPNIVFFAVGKPELRIEGAF
jgi:hypothetical protein